MKVPLSWLREYVEVDVAPEKLAEMLDLSGTKVEALHRPQGEIAGVVVAEVLEVLEHPNSDKLTLVDVRTDDGSQRVVCGARNIAAGDRVPLARVGARLPGMEITERKIRGEVSRGMLCSAAELGVSRDHSGILVLPPDSPLGQDVVPVLGLDDSVFELEVTPNRPDCMSVVGVAREVAALLAKDLKAPPEDGPAGDATTNPVRVDIEDPDGCGRYVARWIAGVRVGPSPIWMSRRLLAAGVRPISNVVDVTNYVMLEMGQPLHAFDADQVHDHHIIVRRARRDERVRTLDGTERSLHPDDLLITDPRRVLALAGVMGGEDSEVSADTTDVILESAHFSAPGIAFTARRHLLRTEASARFERGVDPEITARAAARAAGLIAAIAGGSHASAACDAHPREHRRAVVTLRPSRASRVLGMEVDASAQQRYLRSLGFGVAGGQDGSTLEVEVPGYRPDVTREEDLIEEVGRLAGFDRLPSTIPSGHAGGLDPKQRGERRLRLALAALGVAEAWTSSFSSPGEIARLGLDPDGPAGRFVRIDNPLGEETSVLRTTVLPGLLRSAALNVAHRRADLALFEVARVYESGDQELPYQALMLGAVFCGARTGPHWGGPPQPWDFFAVKGTLLAALRMAGAPEPAFRAAEGPPFHPTRAAALVLGDAPIGTLGELHPDVCERAGVPEGTIVVELAVDPLLDRLRARVRHTEASRFPGIYIDMAVVADSAVPAADLQAAIVEAGGPELAEVALFDIYTGAQVPPGHRSLAFGLELRSPERTLTDDDAIAVRDRIVGVLSERFGARLRA